MTQDEAREQSIYTSRTLAELANGIAVVASTEALSEIRESGREAAFREGLQKLIADYMGLGIRRLSKSPNADGTFRLIELGPILERLQTSLAANGLSDPHVQGLAREFLKTLFPPLAYVGLGSNLGDRLQLLRAATDRLAPLGTLVARSAIYETAPVGPPQPDYLNAVVLLRTDLAPEQLLAGLLEIEVALGRVRRERWGPRLIDLDLLAVDALTISTPAITLPHPEIAHRAFVLRPWLDLAPALALPGIGRIRTLWEALPEAERQAVRPFAAGWTSPA